MKLKQIQEARYQTESQWLVIAKDLHGRQISSTGPFNSKQEAEKFTDHAIQAIIPKFEEKGLEYGKDASFEFKIEMIPSPDDFIDGMSRALETFL